VAAPIKKCREATVDGADGVVKIYFASFCFADHPVRASKGSFAAFS